ncbi:PilT protein-like protein [Thioploca ingrica]|uniref:PilT protein-like protein n=1 Tax=Thioploca ingrica TaxID=40754 RepID=A0A090BVB5_9GAMM|nr:PilT protein-like protein [Thioploca ingrica]
MYKRSVIHLFSDNQRQDDLRHWLECELPEWFEKRLLPINADIADFWGKLQAKMNRPLPAIDSLLAATALYHDLCLVTRNTKDFAYPNLTVINPWE